MINKHNIDGLNVVNNRNQKNNIVYIMLLCCQRYALSEYYLVSNIIKQPLCLFVLIRLVFQDTVRSNKKP